MAETSSSQEKTLDPTPQRIREARERGEFARSREITTVAIFFVMLVFFTLGQRFMLGNAMKTAEYYLRFDSLLDISRDSLTNFIWICALQMIPLLLPFLALVFLAGLGAELGQIGITAAKDPFELKWNRLDPVAGLKRIFSLRQMVEGLKSVLKLSIFVYVAFITIRKALPEIATMTDNTPMEATRMMLGLGLKLGYRTCLVLAFLSGFDYFFQRWQYMKKLRMSHEEMKEELKQHEGDPILKQRIRSIQMEIARRRMMSAVPDSDVIITNPNHYAVALRYDPKEGSAPRVVAKGQNFLAQKIKEVARENEIPLVENPPLARALYKKVAVGGTIPADLFKAVAQILASIWLLAQKRGREWAQRAA